MGTKKTRETNTFNQDVTRSPYGPAQSAIDTGVTDAEAVYRDLGELATFI